MIWTAFKWVWRLEAPLFVGMPPAGALNHCRLYVPARAMHGAVTAELARLDGDKNDRFPLYKSMLEEVGENCRFTYLFPAKELEKDRFLVWMPKFEAAKGLQWQSYGGGENLKENYLSDRDFRRRLLDSRPGTAIDPESDSAAEGTLRETECINPWWRDSNNQGKADAVLLLGYVFLKNNGFRRQMEHIDTLFVGGDTRYGLGKIRRIAWNNPSDKSFVFGKQVHLDGKHPRIESDIVWGHALDQDKEMQGAKELLGGWDQYNLWQGESAWTPGSFLKHGVATWSIDHYGYWKGVKK